MPDRSVPFRLGSAPLALGLALLLGACTGGAPAASPATTPAVDTDSVQTDAPVTSPAVTVSFAEYAPGAESIEAGALVEGLVEDGGTCVLTAAHEGGEQIQGPGNAGEPGPSTTDCGLLTVPLPRTESGATWLVTVTYSSPTTQLSSQPVEVTLP